MGDRNSLLETQPLLNAGSRTHSKKRAEGAEERLHVLHTLWPDARRCFALANERFRRAELSRDDIVDAIACALTARYSSWTHFIPITPQFDSEGMPMRITYLKPDVSPEPA